MSLTVVSRRVLALLSLLVPLLVAPVLPAGSTPALVVPTRAEREHVRPRVGEPTVVRLDAPAAHVAAYWQGHAGARVQLAFSEDGERFGPWRDAGRDEDARRSGTTWGALHGVERADAVRVRTDRPVGKVTVLAISDAVPTVTEDRQVAASAEAATIQPPVVPRGGWGADEALMTWAPQFYETRKLVVHHTAGSSSFTDQAAAAAEVRAIYRYHAVDKGWGDIGYNFLIDPFGNVYEGRYSRDYAGATPSGDDALGRGVTAAHTSGWNSGTVGVAMLGTYTDADITPAARQALTQLLAWEASRHGIDPEATSTFVNPVSGASISTANIAGHRDYGSTECPGASFYAALPQLRRDVAAEIAGPVPAPDTSAPTAPASIQAVGYRARVEVGWAAASDDTAVTSYQLQRKRGTGSFATIGSPSGTAYVDTSVARRTSYTYRVRARDAAGNVSPWSPSATTRTG